MSSMKPILALVPGLLLWSLWPPQSTAGGVHQAALPEILSASVVAEAVGGGLAQQTTGAPKRDFAIFDATLYKQKPDLAGHGLRPVSMIYSGVLWPKGQDRTSLPDRDVVHTVAAQASKSTGVAVIDIESWPLIGDPAVVGESVRKFETVIQWFKETAPSVKVGYYGVTPVWDYWNAIQPTESPKYIAWQKTNDRVASIARLEDMLFPSIYTFYEDQIGWSKVAIRQIQEARRISGGKPVYVFLWPQYHTSPHAYLPAEYWRMELETARKYADGVVIWGGSSETWDENSPWWRETKRFLMTAGSGGH
jgi:hypothetical protein